MADENEELEEKIFSNIKKSLSHQREWRVEAREDYDFYAGRQFSDDEEAALEELGRPSIIYNRIGPYIDAVQGHQLNNQMDIKFFPRQ